MKVRSKITTKYQITIPKEVRAILKLQADDIIEWELGIDGIRIHAADKPFLKHRGELSVGDGDIKADIRQAWINRAERYRT